MKSLALFHFAVLLHLLLSPSAMADWTAQQSGTTVDLEGISSIDALNVWCVGGIGSGSSYTILHTTNGGMTWTSQLSGSGFRLYDVDFVDASNGWAVGEFGTILHTADGGTTWTLQVSNDPHNLFGVHFVDSQTGWVSGDWQTLIQTTNGGTTWIQQSVASQRALEDVFFVSSTIGWTSGNGGSVFSTTDGGNTWQQQNSGVTSSLNGPFFSDESRGWVPGGGFVLHTSDGGTTWTQQTTGTSQALNELHFANADEGWVVGSAGIIIRTTNGGVTWENQISGTGENLRAIEFADNKVGWAVGYGGTILSTTNGGDTGVPCNEIDLFAAKCDVNGSARAMVRLLHSTEYAGETIEFQLDDTVYPVELITNGTQTIGRLEVPLVGYGQHTITLASPGGCYDPITFNCQVGEEKANPEFDALWDEFSASETDVADIRPMETRLIGNYPNPFNPVTTISYELPVAGHVSLVVTDIIGREVARLVNGYQEAGYKTVSFDASDLASGVYFYRLQAGDFVGTRKLLLVR